MSDVNLKLTDVALEAIMVTLAFALIIWENQATRRITTAVIMLAGYIFAVLCQPVALVSPKARDYTCSFWYRGEHRAV